MGVFNPDGSLNVNEQPVFFSNGVVNPLFAPRAPQVAPPQPTISPLGMMGGLNSLNSQPNVVQPVQYNPNQYNPVSQGQINSFKFLFNSADPATRQQMLQNAHPAFVNAVAGQSYNAPTQNQTPGLGWRDQLTNGAIGLANSVIQPVQQGVQQMNNFQNGAPVDYRKFGSSFGQTVLNAGSLIPAGAIVGDAGRALEGVNMARNIATGAAKGVGAGAAFGGAQGAMQAYGDRQNVLQGATQGAENGAIVGGVLGGGAPLVGAGVHGLAAGIEHITPHLSQVMSDYANIAKGSLTNENGALGGSDPLRHDAGTVVNGENAGGRFKPLSNEEYIANPQNKIDYQANIAKATETLGEINKAHEDVLTKINTNRGITDDTRQQLLDHHNALYEANREDIGEHLDNFVRQYEAKYPGSSLPKQLVSTMDTELTRVPHPRYDMPSQQTIHEMNASMDNTGGMIEGKNPAQVAQAPTRASLYQKLHGNFSGAIDNFKNVLNNKGAVGGSDSNPLKPIYREDGSIAGYEPAKAKLDKTTPDFGAGTTDPQAIAKGLGMSKDELATAKANQSAPKSEDEVLIRQQKAASQGVSDYDAYVAAARRENAPEILSKEQYNSIFKSAKEMKDEANQPVKLTRQERQDIINNQEGQQTRNHVSMEVERDNVKGAIAKATGVSDEANDRLLEAQKAGRKLDEHDRNLLYRVENGESVRTVAKEAHSRADFKNVVAKLQDAFDYTLAALRSAGSLTFRQHDYIIPHYYEATPEKMDELGVAPDDRVTFGRKTGFHDKSAKYSSYIEAEKHGLSPLYQNPMDAVDVYRQGASSFIRNNGLYQSLKSAVPDKVAELGTASDNAGNKFTQAAGRLPFNATEDVNDALKNFRSTKISNPAFRAAYAAARGVNSIQKAILFFGAPFHYMNITSNFLGLTSTTGHELLAGKGIREALENEWFNPGGYAKNLEKARADGTLAYLREELGMTVNSDHAAYRPDTAMGNVKGALDKVNILGLTHRDMNRFIDGYAIELARAAKARGIHGQEAIALGHEYDMVLGRINAAVEGHNPFISKLIGDAGLAPMFTRSQLGLARDAVLKSNPFPAASVKGVTLEHGTAKHGLGIYNAGDVARGTVVGKRALEAVLAITGSAIIAGKMPTLAKIINEAGLNPNNPVPNIDLQHKNKSGHNQVMNLPTDQAGLAAMAVTDPMHFLQSRSSPTMSFFTRLATNKDWNGNDIVDKSQPGWQGKLLMGAAAGGLPIGAQNAMGVASGNLTLGQGIAQEFGGRVKTDPNDPGVIQGQQHFKSLAQARASLGSNDQAVWDAINPQTKMADGTYTQAANWNTFKDPAKVYELLSHPNVLNAMVQASQAQPSHDPMWDLPVTADAGQPSLTTFLIHEGLQGTDYGSATAKTIVNGGPTQVANPWINDVNTARSAYFATLPKSQNPNASNPVQYPTVDAATQNLMNLEQQISAIPPTQRTPQQTQLLNSLYSNPQLTSALQASTNYTQARRVQQGVPMFATAPTVTPYVQAQMNAKNWSDPQVQAYLNADAAFKVSGPFGNGIQGAGGMHNTPQYAMQNLAMGLSANGKPSSYSSSHAAAMRRSLRNQAKYAFKNEKYTVKQSQKMTKKLGPIVEPKPKGFLAQALHGYGVPKKHNTA